MTTRVGVKVLSVQNTAEGQLRNALLTVIATARLQPMEAVAIVSLVLGEVCSSVVECGAMTKEDVQIVAAMNVGLGFNGEEASMKEALKGMEPQGSC